MNLRLKHLKFHKVYSIKIKTLSIIIFRVKHLKRLKFYPFQLLQYKTLQNLYLPLSAHHNFLF